MKLKLVSRKNSVCCSGCVFDGDGCQLPEQFFCGNLRQIYVVDEEASLEEQQNETKPRFKPEWGC